MENNQLYLIQLARRTKQTIEELKSLNNRLRTEDIDIPEMQNAIRLLDQTTMRLDQELRRKQGKENEKKGRTIYSR